MEPPVQTWCTFITHAPGVSRLTTQDMLRACDALSAAHPNHTFRLHAKRGGGFQMFDCDNVLVTEARMQLDAWPRVHIQHVLDGKEPFDHAAVSRCALSTAQARERMAVYFFSPSGGPLIDETLALALVGVLCTTIGHKLIFYNTVPMTMSPSIMHN
jgi:hypothetical protein